MVELIAEFMFWAGLVAVCIVPFLATGFYVAARLALGSMRDCRQAEAEADRLRRRLADVQAIRSRDNFSMEVDGECVEVDRRQGVIRVAGLPYAVAVLAGDIVTPPGKAVRITREDDGVLTVEQLDLAGIVNTLTDGLEAESDLLDMIEQLRAEEGDSLTILCDDPEAVACNARMAVECSGGWTEYNDRRFYGPDVETCLARALLARQLGRPEYGKLTRQAEEPVRDSTRNWDLPPEYAATLEAMPKEALRSDEWPREENGVCRHCQRPGHDVHAPDCPTLPQSDDAPKGEGA